jgi:hypothetical protein
VSHTKGLSVNVSIAHKVLPAGYGYDLEGYLSLWAFQFLSFGHSSGSVITTADTSETALPNYITTRGYGTMNWHSFNIPMGDTTTFGNVIFITWATPLETPTRKRLEWACNAAGWFPGSPPQTEENVADAIWTTLSGNPPLEPPWAVEENPEVEQGATWKLLDGNVSGECDEQAGLMMRAMNVLGIAASTGKVRASTNVSVLDQETQFFPWNGGTRKAYLIMDFNVNGDPDPPGGNGWNAFEGFCNTASFWYAVWPHYKGSSALDLYRQVPFEQFWVFTVNNNDPSTSKNWNVEQVVPGTTVVPKA